MEVVLRTKAKQADLAIEFDSAGTESYHIGDPPDPRSVRHAQTRGYDLSAGRARHAGPRLGFPRVRPHPRCG